MENETQIKVNGKLYTEIVITPESAIEVLFKDCFLHGKNILEKGKTEEKSVEIFKALSTLKKNYSSIIGENMVLSVRSVFNSEDLEFTITSNEALDALYKKFFRGSGNSLCTSYGTEEKGVYSCCDISYHGSSLYEYSLIYPGIKAEETLKALIFLKRNYYGFINENKESQIKHR